VAGGGVDDTARAPIAVRASFATLSRQWQAVAERLESQWSTAGDLAGGTQRPNSGTTAAPPEGRARGARGYWLSPPGLVTMSATGVALAIRLYLLTRLRYLTGITACSRH
jgi:hypothetical protein